MENFENIIYEYSRVKSDALSKYIKKNESLHKYFKEDWGAVKAKQYCGILNFNGDDFYILPKISDADDADKYQMFVYGTNFNVKDTMLLYPKHIYNVSEYLKLGKDDKMIGLEMRSVDLDFSGGYSEFVKEIKSRLENINE